MATAALGEGDASTPTALPKKMFEQQEERTALGWCCLGWTRQDVRRPRIAAAPGFVGKNVAIHFTASSLSLGSGPRRDIIKGKVLSADAEWVVLQVSDADKPLYIPRTSVMAIQVE